MSSWRHTNLRFDDTNPRKEETEYADSIEDSVRWLGYHWDGLYYASDYFDQLYESAIQLIKAGKAYVDDLQANEIREYRGTLTPAWQGESVSQPLCCRKSRSIRAHACRRTTRGSRASRADDRKASPNLNMRDPVMYRILHAEDRPPRNKRPCISPMYDYAHGQSDSIERVTHSMSTLEFEDHRPLYNWFIEQLGIFPSQQIEFDRLNLTYTLLSKRKLLKLVNDGLVRGWDNPRMPTLSWHPPSRVHAGGATKLCCIHRCDPRPMVRSNWKCSNISCAKI